MSKHKDNKKAVEEALGKKFFTGRNADWGGAQILSITGGEFYGLFIIDMDSLTGEEDLILMYRLFNPTTERTEDTDIILFESEFDNIYEFIKKLEII